MAWSGSRDPFLRLGAKAIFLEHMKLDISNLVCRLNVKSIGITRVKVMQYGWGCIYGHVEIITSISETVQDRHIVTVED